MRSRTATMGPGTDPGRAQGSGIDIRTTRTNGRTVGRSIAIGEPVEVRNRFDDSWSHGFSVAVVGEGAYQLRRLSDGSVLPAWFPAQMVRVERTD